MQLWKKLKKEKLATPNLGLITDTICCPGMDYCALATARSIPISQKISSHFKNYLKQKEIGDLKIRVYAMISNTNDNLKYYLTNGIIEKEKLANDARQFVREELKKLGLNPDDFTL